MWISPQEYKAVGQCLSEVRKKANLTQQELAARLAKPQSFVSAYEAGQRRIDVLELQRICRALEADPLAVFTALIQGR